MKSGFANHLEDILTTVREYYPEFDPEQEDRIRRAFAMAEEAHRPQVRDSGEPYFLHPIEATKILLTIKPDVDTICSCLLHDVIEDTPVTAEEVEAEFGKRIRFLCEGVEKVAKIRVKKDPSQETSQNIQKLFIAMSKDIRVIFIKLADRIHNLRTLEYVKPHKRERIARESCEVYAPVAEKFGLFEFKSEIENVSFKWLHPRIYKRINDEVRTTKKAREKFVKQARREILKKFHAENLEIEEIQSRQKDDYSIYQKMRRKNIQRVDEIYDFLGIRIIVKSNEDCYRALGILHSFWHPMSRRFKDYIAVPKPNGYQSLHTTLLGLGQNTLPTEVQIRTRAMDTDAEFGPAAHWAYKNIEGKDFDETYLKKMSWLPKYIQDEKESNPDEFFQHISDSIFSERIYIFTPKGDTKFFVKGSTPVDFAYSIHSDIGDSCTGARVNGAMKPLDYRMKNGDIVTIITRMGRLPNPLWLNFVKTNNAREKIKRTLRENEEVISDVSQAIIKKSANISQVIKSVEIEAKPEIKKSDSMKLVIGGQADLPHKLAHCCNPRKKDAVVAYKGKGLLFSIHKQGCPELEKLEPERMLEAYFQRKKTLRIFVNDGKGVFVRMSSIISDQGIDIYKVSSKRYPDRSQVLLTFSLFIRSEQELQSLLFEIRKSSFFVDFKENGNTKK